MHNKLNKITNMLAREAKEYASSLVNLSCWSSVVAVKWTE